MASRSSTIPAKGVLAAERPFKPEPEDQRLAGIASLTCFCLSVCVWVLKSMFVSVDNLLDSPLCTSQAGLRVAIDFAVAPLQSFRLGSLWQIELCSARFDSNML